MASYAYHTTRQEYIYGNNVRKEKEKRQGQQKPQKRASERVKENKQKAISPMSVRYVIFLTISSIVSLFACICYLSLNAKVTSVSSQLTNMQKELCEIKEANTARDSALVNAMNLIEIREIAVNEFGMFYSTPEQIVQYESPNKHSVVQYYEIPEDGIIAGGN